MSLMESIVHGDNFESHTAGLVAPSAVILDNDWGSVEPMLKYLRKRGFNTFLTSDPSKAILSFKKLGNMAVYLFDMHMDQYKRLGSRDTMHGTAVGLVAVNEITNDGKDDKIEHCAIITEYDDAAAVGGIFKLLKSRGQSVERIDKGEFDQFVRFIDTFEDSFHRTQKGDIVRKNIDAVTASFAPLAAGKDFDSALAAMMGYLGSDRRYWDSSRDEVLQNASRDIYDRIEALAYIKQGIAIHFGQNIEAETAWCHRSRPELGDRSVWDCLTSGSLSDVNLAASFVNATIG